MQWLAYAASRWVGSPLGVTRFLTLTAVAYCTVVVVDISVLLAFSCPFDIRRHAETQERFMPSEACHSLDRGLRTARIIAFVCTYLGVGALLVHRVLHIHRLQSHRLPPAVRGFKPPQDIPGSWVFAASPNIFRNTLLLLRSTNVLYGLVAGPTVAALLGVYAVAGHQSRQGGCPEEIVRQCAGSEVCEFTIAWSILPAAASTLVAGVCTVHFLSCPVNVWSRAMDIAFRVTGKRKAAGRSIKLPGLVAAGFSLAMLHTIFRQIRIVSGKAGPTEVMAYLGLQVASLVVQGLALWHTRILQDTVSWIVWKLWSGGKATARIFPSPSPSPVSSGRQSGSSDSDAPSNASLMSNISVYNNAADISIGLSDDVSRRNLLLILLIILLATRVEGGTPLTILVGVNILRAVLAALIVFLPGSKTSTFQDIEHSAGFGLIVCAADLSRALRKYQAGGNVLATKPLRYYKATPSRMDDTLAVSYRWQSSEVELGHGTVLNMNDFQLRSLLTAIRQSGASFVWLDRLSVPQAHCPLKFTLLARMLAVYSAARSTVAIRTIEEPGSRYHQRVWTCQEYCTARQLYTAVEEATGDMESADLAETADEIAHVNELRDEYIEGALSVVPLWLRQPGWLGPEHARRILAIFHSLSQQLNSTNSSDKVRALLPLVSLTPVEDHSQLAALVLQLSEAVGQDLSEMKEALLDSHISVKDSHVSTFVQSSLQCMRQGALDMGKKSPTRKKLRNIHRKSAPDSETPDMSRYTARHTDPDTSTLTRKSIEVNAYRLPPFAGRKGLRPISRPAGAGFARGTRVKQEMRKFNSSMENTRQSKLSLGEGSTHGRSTGGSRRRSDWGLGGIIRVPRKSSTTGSRARRFSVSDRLGSIVLQAPRATWIGQMIEARRRVDS